MVLSVGDVVIVKTNNSITNTAYVPIFKVMYRNPKNKVTSLRPKKQGCMQLTKYLTNHEKKRDFQR